MAECVYATTFSMRDPKGKRVSDIFPSLFEDDDEDEQNEPPISDEEVSELQELMSSINRDMNISAQTSEA